MTATADAPVPTTVLRIPGKFEFHDGFLEEPSLTDQGVRLIHKHDDLHWLDGFTVRFLWKEKGGQSSGQLRLGKCILTSGLARFFGACDYVIWIAADHVRRTEMSHEQIEALLYHELLHCEMVTDDDSDEVRAGVRGHDVETFYAEVAKYGLWRPSLSQMQQVMQFGGDAS